MFSLVLYILLLICCVLHVAAVLGVLASFVLWHVYEHSAEKPKSEYALLAQKAKAFAEEEKLPEYIKISGTYEAKVSKSYYLTLSQKVEHYKKWFFCCIIACIVSLLFSGVLVGCIMSETKKEAAKMAEENGISIDDLRAKYGVAE